MRWIGRILAGFVALQHLGFMILEMVLWTHPIGLKVFKQSAEAAEQSKVLAANQGLYNGFLAAGLVWALLSKDQARPRLRFFLICVVVAGIFGGATASPMIAAVQGAPAALALVFCEWATCARSADAWSAVAESEKADPDKDEAS